MTDWNNWWRKSAIKVLNLSWISPPDNVLFFIMLEACANDEISVTYNFDDQIFTEGCWICAELSTFVLPPALEQNESSTPHVWSSYSKSDFLPPIPTVMLPYIHSISVVATVIALNSDCVLDWAAIVCFFDPDITKDLPIISCILCDFSDPLYHWPNRRRSTPIDMLKSFVCLFKSNSHLLSIC